VHNINQVADLFRGYPSHDAGMNEQQSIQSWSRTEYTGPGTAQRARDHRLGPIAGLPGLACYVAGSLVAALPRPGATATAVTTQLAAHRLAVLAGSDAGGYAAGAGPLLWIIWAAALATTALLRPRASAN
jgi:hypothetical protein